MGRGGPGRVSSRVTTRKEEGRGSALDQSCTAHKDKGERQVSRGSRTLYGCGKLERDAPDRAPYSSCTRGLGGRNERREGELVLLESKTRADESERKPRKISPGLYSQKSAVSGQTPRLALSSLRRLVLRPQPRSKIPSPSRLVKKGLGKGGRKAGNVSKIKRVTIVKHQVGERKTTTGGERGGTGRSLSLFERGGRGGRA